MATRGAKRKLAVEEQPTLPTWRKPPDVPRSQARRKASARKPGYQVAVAALQGIAAPAPSEVWAQWRSALSTRQWVVVIASTVLVAGILFLISSRFFAVETDTVSVVGNQRVSADAIYRASALDQRNLFRIDPGTSASLVTGLPAIESANVHLRLPDQAIIDVREYQPLLAWQVFTQTLWIAADGSPIPVVGDPPGLRLVDEGGAAMDDRGAIRQNLLDALVLLHAAYPEVVEVWYGALEGLYFRSPRGWTVYMGSGDAMAAKLDLLQSTERELSARGTPITRIDMRFPGQALLK